MAYEARQPERGDWILEKKLGQGGFGVVELWKNKENGETLALKKCRLGPEMTPKHKKRWSDECSIMLRLNHPNVVRALEVPTALQDPSDGIPILAMEYCTSGDLRRVLNRPENSCGLKEGQCRAIARDIASAIEYLHAHKVVHRDIKPENIVMQPVDEKIAYKLIDLGYAKDLDQNSHLISFVGTMQYLAPELFTQQRYTMTVDYWSFGTTVFECLVGIRPFLHNIPPVKWQMEVCKKENRHIHAYMGPTSKVEFSDKLPEPNHLCRTTQLYFESFLRLMLQWDPQHRGGAITEHNRPKCFQLLQEFISTKLIRIFCVPFTNEFIYPVPARLPLKQICNYLEQEAKIPADEQELLLDTGVSPNPEDQAEKYCASEDNEDIVVFLFRQGDTDFPEKERRKRPTPPFVQMMLGNPKACMNYPDQKKAWAQAVYYCDHVSQDFRRLLGAQRAANVNLMRFKSKFSHDKTKMVTASEELRAKMHFFKDSIEYDIRKHEAQKSDGIYSQNMHESWLKMKVEVESYARLAEDARHLEQQCTALDTRVIELQRSPFAKSRQPDKLQNMFLRCVKMYDDFRKLPKDKQKQATDNSSMVTLVRECMKEWDHQSNALFIHLRKIMECKAEVLRLIPQVQKLMTNMAEARQCVTNRQKQRQRDLWHMVSVALKQNQNLQRLPSSSTSSLSLSVHPVTSTDSSQPAQSRPPGPSSRLAGLPHSQVSLPHRTATDGHSPASSMIPGSATSTSSLFLHKCSEASTQLKNESVHDRHRLQVVADSFSTLSSQTMSVTDDLDWSFLDESSQVTLSTS